MPEVEKVSPSSYLARVRDMDKIESLCSWMVQQKATEPNNAIFITTIVNRMVSTFGYARSSAYKELNRPGFVKIKGPGGIRVWFQADKIMPRAKAMGFSYYPEDPSIFLRDAGMDGFSYHLSFAAETGNSFVVPLINEAALAKALSDAPYLKELREYVEKYAGETDKQLAVLRTTISTLATYYTLIEEGTENGEQEADTDS